jgi:hypothetical protein
VRDQYGPEEAARHSYFEKLNFTSIRDLVLSEGIDCELKWGAGGYDIFLTDEEFSWAKRELEGMKSAHGYTESLKIFDGENGSKVYFSVSSVS